MQKAAAPQHVSTLAIVGEPPPKCQRWSNEGPRPLPRVPHSTPIKHVSNIPISERLFPSWPRRAPVRPSPGIRLGANTQEIEIAKTQKHVIEVLENVGGGQDREVRTL